jgi:hypothetical protein
MKEQGIRVLRGGRVETPMFPEHDRRTTLAERHPDWPAVRLQLSLAPHGNARDMAGLADQMQGADVYFYELRGSNILTPFYQQVAHLDPGPLPADYLDNWMETGKLGKRPIKGTPHEAIIRSLFGTQKIVGHMDLRKDDILNQEITHEQKKPYEAPDFEQTLVNLRNKYQRLSQLDGQREDIMVRRFEEELGKILDAHPGLKERPDLQVLATMGVAHTPLFFKFNAAGVTTECTMPEKPYTYDHNTQAQRAFTFGREPTQDDLARAHLSNILNGALELGFDEDIENSSRRSRYLRTVATAFSVDEIASIHARARYGFRPFEVNLLLADKGLDPLPRTNAELLDTVEQQKAA